MPRDAALTKQLLIDAGRRLFAEHGLFQTPLNQVVQAAGQRNTSALHYHFGGRDGLLTAIIEEHNSVIETERRQLLDALDADGRSADLRSLVEAVVVPFSRMLADPDGRRFLAIVAQLGDVFDRWDDEERSPAQARRAFHAIEDALDPTLGRPLRHERVTRFLELVTDALGSRARQQDRRRDAPPPAITDGRFVSNLIDMAVGALAAPTTATG